MKILGFADPHAGATHLTTLAEQERAFDEVREIIVREQIDLVLIGGDLFHHNRPSPEAIGVVGRFFDGLRIPAIMAKGNHDPDAAEIARYLRGRIWVPNSPEVIHHPSGVDVAVLPYLPDRHVRAQAGGNATKEEIARALTEKVREILRGFAAQKRPGVPMVLVAHGTVAGSVTSTGWSMGFVPGTEWVIPLEELDPFVLTVAGHIHRPQEPAADVIVPGSLLPLDFAETEPKRVIVAEITADDIAWKSVPLTSSPDVSTWEIVPSEIGDLLNNREDWLVSEGEKIRVRYDVDEATAREYPPSRISAALYAAGAGLVQVDLTVERPDRARNANVTGELTPDAALREYLEGRDDLDAAKRLAILRVSAEAHEALRSTSGALAGGDLALESVELHDFLGVREATVNFDGHGVYALTGPVGAGKSTIGCDAIRHTLYGASRAGAKVSDLLIRQGSDTASTSVELMGVDGRRYRVVRKLKRTARGVTSTLDVLESRHSPTLWEPISTGKVADGQAVIDRILGGLTDETLAASSLVIQRQADSFTRARPEDRKRLLAEAAGLVIYDELAEISRERSRASEAAVALLHAKAEPLRERAARVADLRIEKIRMAEIVKTATEDAEKADRRREETAQELEQAKAKATERSRLADEVARLNKVVADLEDEAAPWKQKQKAATTILAEREVLLAAKAELAVMNERIAELQTQQAAETTQVQHRAAALEVVHRLKLRIADLRAERERGRAEISSQIDAAERQQKRLDDSACPVLAQITAGGLAACSFLKDARTDVAALDELARALGVHSEPGKDESEVIAAAAKVEIPDAIDTAPTVRAMAAAQREARVLEDKCAVADKIARAEQVLVEAEAALEQIVQRGRTAGWECAAAKAMLEKMPAVDVIHIQMQMHTFGGYAQQARRQVEDARQRIGFLEGQIAEAQKALADLDVVECDIASAAQDVAAWKELVIAWRACRVLVLESSVIPAVEQTANEILRRFPYGIQLALTTQREKRSSDGVSETLDLEVLGGRGQVYELCSGGQKTTIDFSLHVAIALVVSRRSSTRLRFLFADEPEGLDEAGRAAFAGLARWIHDEYDLAVLVASHAADLVDALGGQRLEVVPGPDGSTVVIG